VGCLTKKLPHILQTRTLCSDPRDKEEKIWQICDCSSSGVAKCSSNNRTYRSNRLIMAKPGVLKVSWALSQATISLAQCRAT